MRQPLLWIALTIAFIVIPVFAVFAAGEIADPAAQYGVTGLLAVAMAGMGWVIRSSLTQQIAIMKQQAASNDRLSRGVLIIAQEFVRRPCVATSQQVRALADELLSEKEEKEGRQQ